MKYDELLKKVFIFNKKATVNANVLESLTKLTGSEENPKFFFSMTQINKLGINPKSVYNTPLGVYSYPLTNVYLKKLMTQKLPFAGDAPYINVFSISSTTFNLKNYTQNDLDKDVEKLKMLYNDPEFESIMKKAFFTARQQTPISQFWNFTRLLSKTALQWNVLFRNLGYDHFYDPGMGLIHPSEPTQCVILDPRIIILVETYLNPHADDLYRNNFLNKEDKNILVQKKRQINLSDENKSDKNKFVDNSQFSYDNIEEYSEDFILSYLNKKNTSTVLHKEDISIPLFIMDAASKNKLRYVLKFEKVFNLLSDFCVSKNLAIKKLFMHCTNSLQKMILIKKIINEEIYDIDLWEIIFKDINSLNDDYLLNKIISLLPPIFRTILDAKNIINLKLKNKINVPIYENSHEPIDKEEKYALLKDHAIEYYKGNLLHREDGPAIEYVNGYKYYYLNGLLHRENGPAIENVNGYKEYYFHGKKIKCSSTEEFLEIINNLPK